MKKTVGKVVGQLVLILFAVIVLYPLFFIFMTSFKSNFDVISNPFGIRTFQPQNYWEAWESGRIGRYFLNSVIITVITLAHSDGSDRAGFLFLCQVEALGT